MLRITGPLRQQSCLHCPLSKKRKVKINKEFNKQGAVGKAHKISIVAPALFAPYQLGRERKRSIV